MEDFYKGVENTPDYLKGKSQKVVNLMNVDKKPHKEELPTHLRMVYGHVDWDSLIFKLDEDIIRLIMKNKDNICVGWNVLGRMKVGDHVAILNTDTLGPVTYWEMMNNCVDIELLDLDEAIDQAAKWFVDDLLDSVFSFSLFTPYFLLAFRLALMQGSWPDEERFLEARLEEEWRKTYSSVLFFAGQKLQQEAIGLGKSGWQVSFDLAEYQVDGYLEARDNEESIWD